MLCIYLSLALVALAAAQIPPSPTGSPPAPPFVPLCDPANFTSSSGLPFPDLPDQFSFILEQSEAEFNATVILTLYYDGPGVIKFWGPHENGDPGSPF